MTHFAPWWSGLWAAHPALEPVDEFPEKIIMRATKTLLTTLIRLYRVLLSPLIPPSCRFHPSCSEYALQAAHHYSAPKALLLIGKRVLRCHPFHPGGHDPLPQPDAEP